MTSVLDGRALAAQIQAEVAAEAAELTATGIPPQLAIVVATDDESSAWYVRAIERAAGRCGVATTVIDLGPGATHNALAGALTRLAEDPAVHGVILQTPLPAGVSGAELAELIPPAKDVDGASPLSAGRLVTGQQAFAPATAAAVLELLRAHDVKLAGTSAVVVGRSVVVGKPVVQLLLAENATVTVCHSRTKDLAAVCQGARVLVAAIGRPRMISAEYVSPGAIVVDVGTTPDADGNLIGDVDAAAVEGIAGALSPVPGGVGPVTTALLLRNTVAAARLA